MSNIRDIIFDMDGTLIDSSDVISNSINHVRHKIGLRPLQKEDILKVVNDIKTPSSIYFYESQEFLPEHISWFQDYYTLHHEDEVKAYDGVIEMLKRLKDEKSLALATNAYRVSALQILKHLDMEKYFEIVVCGDDVERSKPHPDMIKKIISHFDSHKDRVVVVGDSIKDRESASRAGVKSILVNFGFTDRVDDALTSIVDLEKVLLGVK
jgi:phosphoglycolate phosphatase